MPGGKQPYFISALKAVLVEEAERLAADLDAAAAVAIALRDKLLALADFSARSAEARRGAGPAAPDPRGPGARHRIAG
jgi:hypothetical protein